MTPFGGDAWLGGYYELAVELGPPSDDRLAAALDVVWQHPDLEGCYLRRDMEPAGQERVPPRLPGEHGSHLYGVATIPVAGRVPCCTVVVREDGGSDWLDLALPTGGLSEAIPAAGGFPFGDDTGRSWRRPLDDWLAGVGRHIHRAVPFRLGLVGFEVSGMDDAARIEAEGLPEKRWIGYLVPRGDVLEWHPVDQWRPRR